MGLTTGFSSDQSGTASGFPIFLFGGGAILFLPVLYGVLGFLSGALMAWLYNVVAGHFGGIDMQVEFEPGDQRTTTERPSPDLI